MYLAYTSEIIKTDNEVSGRPKLWPNNTKRKAMQLCVYLRDV